MQLKFLNNMARFLSVLCAFVFSSAEADIFLTCNYGTVDESDAADPTLYTWYTDTHSGFGSPEALVWLFMSTTVYETNWSYSEGRDGMYGGPVSFLGHYVRDNLPAAIYTIDSEADIYAMSIRSDDWGRFYYFSTVDCPRPVSGAIDG